MNYIFLLLLALFPVSPTQASAQQTVIDVYTFTDSSIHIEGISRGLSKHSFFAGGVNTGQLYEVYGRRIDTIKLPEEWPPWSQMGMKIDRNQKLLFIARTALPQSPDTTMQYHGSDVLVYDIKHRGFLKRIPMIDREGIVVFNDIAFSPGGQLLVSDAGRPGGVYELNWKEGDFCALNIRGIRSPQGIVAMDSMVYIAGYSQGLFRYDISKDTAVLMPVTGLTNELKFMDGLALYKGRLIAICNGAERAVVRINPETMEGSVIADLRIPKYNEPTLCTVQGNRLYFVSNSQWESYCDHQGKSMRTPAIISALNLE